MAGICTCLQAATRLRELWLVCYDLIDAAQADKVLRTCTHVTELHLTGSHMPHFYPAGLNHLEVDFTGREPGETAWDPLVPSCLLCSLEHQAAVKTLVLEIKSARVC